MPTLRFGTPAATDPEQVTLRTRWGDPDVPDGTAYRHVFPYAMAVSSTAVNATVRDAGGSGTVTISPLSTAGVPHLIHHPDSGIVRNGINCLALYDIGGAYDATNSIVGRVDAQTGGRLPIIASLERDIGTSWFGLDAVPNDNNATIDGLLASPLAHYATEPSIIFYAMKDDLTDSALNTALANGAMERVSTLDAAARPASPSFLDTFTAPDITRQARVVVMGGSSYPCRTGRVEGDFTVMDGYLGTTHDWYEWPRNVIHDLPAGCRLWWWAQGHQFAPSGLRYPTAREIRKQVWELVGAGVTGILWFIWQDWPDEWDGLAHPNSRERLDAVAEMGRRLTPTVQQRLLTARPMVNNDDFAATGGGSGGTWMHVNYDSANVMTLYDDAADQYLVVVVNRSLSTANITITSDTLDGVLVNLETGRQVPLGRTFITLPPLDGTIFRFVPAGLTGVPPSDLTDAEMTLTADERWAQHWANPASATYIAPGALPTHPRTVQLSQGDRLQSAIDAHPDNTTFVLAPGPVPYGRVTLYGRNGIHIIAADPDDKPIVNGVEGYASIECYYYHDWVLQVISTMRNGDFSTNTPEQDAARDAYVNLPRDVILRDLRIEPAPGVLTTTPIVTTRFAGTHRKQTNMPFEVIGYQDILIERCDFSGWKYADNDGIYGDPPFNGSMAHDGMITGHGGSRGIIVRNCTLTGHDPFPESPWGYPSAVYLDGAVGCVLLDNTVNGRWNALIFLFLTNDDFTDDYDGNGIYDERIDMPYPKYNVIQGNTVEGGYYFFSGSAAHMIIDNNTWSSPGAAPLNFAEFKPSELSGPFPPDDAPLTDIFVRNNTITGTCGQTANGTVWGVVHLTLAGQLAEAGSVGRVTVTGNHVIGSVPNGWFIDDTGGNDADPNAGLAAEPNVVSGNTTGA